MLEFLLPLYLLPLAACLLLALPTRFSEKFIGRTTGISLVIPANVTILIFAYKGLKGLLPLEHRVVTLRFMGHAFDLIFWLDAFSIAMLSLTHVLAFMVVKYSHGYLHLEKGYQRYFSTILFFIFGMYLISVAGTIDIFFAGWEIVGFSSFLLIAFYRSHTRSVINAWRIYNIYRVCDVGLLMGAVLGHYFWHEATRFSGLASALPSDLTATPRNMILLLSSFLVFASLGKSAQFPFHVWPSKAMEGPTPSSAIFYGALSIHAGVFLLIRTQNLWSLLWEIKLLVGLIGALTLILSTLQGRVQSNIKGQIAYASTAQIGIMFIELAFGFTTLAMFHLFFHAIYRCFQLLLSPSVVASSLTLNNEVVLGRIKNHKRWEVSILPARTRATLYTLSLNDFFLDPSWRGFRFLPWIKIHMILRRLISRPTWMVTSILIFASLELVYSQSLLIPPITMSFLSLYFSLRALFFQNDAFHSFLDLSLSLVLDMLSIFLQDRHSLNEIKLFMFSVIPALVVGLWILRSFRDLNLQDFHAQGRSYPIQANLFLLSFLILSGMPLSTAFIGEDVLLEVLIKSSPVMAFFTMISLMLNGFICVRIYTRIFMGKKSSLLT